MAELDRIPGARRRRAWRTKRSAARAGWHPSRGRAPGSVLHDPSAGFGRRRPRLGRPSSGVQVVDALLVAAAVGVAGFLLWTGWRATRVHVEVVGLEDRAQLTSAALEGQAVRFEVRPRDAVAHADLQVEGGRPGEVPDVDLDIDAGHLTWHVGELREGTYDVRLDVPRPLLDDASFRWTFVVDDTPPELDVPDVLSPAAELCRAVAVEGRVEPGAALEVDGSPVDTDDEGRFRLPYDRPPTVPLELTATDAAGNETRREVVVPVHYPGSQGVHVTAAAWGYEPLRTHVLELVDAGLVSTVELDLKDEGGIVGYDSAVPLAHTVGAVRPEYRLRDAVALLEARGVRVVGRIVVFRDPPLAAWAHANGRPDWVVQRPDGSPHGAYGGFTNPASPDVRRYHFDLAAEAVEAGVHDILWDYLRRPEGDPAGMVFPGLQGTPSDAVVDFLAEGREVLSSRCAYQGVSVFGIAADRPDAVGQDIPRIARHVDYIAPMLYPSHWVPGEYGVADPNRQPGDIVRAALADFQEAAAGTGVRFVPWIQDFSLGHRYGPAEVRAQIDAAASLGVHDWLLWNATVRYTAAALDPSLVTATS